jgi:hypothetical protein
MVGIENVLKDRVKSTRCRRANMRVKEAKDIKDRVVYRMVLSNYPVKETIRDMASASLHHAISLYFI